MGNFHLWPAQRQSQKLLVLTDEFVDRLGNLNDVVRTVKKLGCQIISQTLQPDNDAMPIVVISANVGRVDRLVGMADMRQVAKSPSGTFRYGSLIMRGVGIVLETHEANS